MPTGDGWGPRSSWQCSNLSLPLFEGDRRGSPHEPLLLSSSCPTSGNGGLFLYFFGRKWLTLPSPPHDGIHLQTHSSIKSKRDCRSGLCGRETGLGGKPVENGHDRPQQRTPYPGHSLLKSSRPPHRSWSHRCRVPRVGDLLQGLSLAFGGCF